MRATVFGAGGFVGRHLCAHLLARGFDVRRVVRGDRSWHGADLGHVFYCIGLTADFRSRPFETVEAHVGVLADLLRQGDFRSFIYLSSTRVYAHVASTDEAAPIVVNPGMTGDLYNLSKLMGEALCLGCSRPNVRIARLSNVFGDDRESGNFLASILREAAETGRVQLATSLDSEKDYIWIEDAVAALEALATRGSEPITNVAFGANTTHGEIMTALAATAGWTATVAPEAKPFRFPAIETARLDRLTGRARTPLLSILPHLVDVRRTGLISASAGVPRADEPGPPTYPRIAAGAAR